MSLNIIWNRQLQITKDLIGQRVYMYNGRRFFTFLVREEMVGFKVCEFIRTKDFSQSIHEKKNKKKKK